MLVALQKLETELAAAKDSNNVEVVKAATYQLDKTTRELKIMIPTLQAVVAKLGPNDGPRASVVLSETIEILVGIPMVQA